MTLHLHNYRETSKSLIPFVSVIPDYSERILEHGYTDLPAGRANVVEVGSAALFCEVP